MLKKSDYQNDWAKDIKDTYNKPDLDLDPDNYREVAEDAGKFEKG